MFLTTGFCGPCCAGMAVWAKATEAKKPAAAVVSTIRRIRILLVVFSTALTRNHHGCSDLPHDRASSAFFDRKRRFDGTLWRARCCCWSRTRKLLSSTVEICPMADKQDDDRPAGA